MSINNNQSIRIEAFDTLFFRDGKPFTMGAETWADMRFPPSPSVMYGALRAQYFGEHPEKLPLARTETDPTSPLTISLLALHNGDELLFPLPLDYVTDKETDEPEGLLLQRQENTPVSNAVVKRIFVAEPDQIVENEEQGVLDSEQLEQYLACNADTVQYETLADYTVSEPKLGIERNNATHTTEEGMLYRVDMRRLEPKRKFGQESAKTLYLHVRFSGLPITDRGVFRLGGEGKMAAYYPGGTHFPAAPSLQNSRFKLYLATPALFQHGWLPGWIDPNTLHAITPPYSDLKMRLDTAILGKPVRIGGFWMKTEQYNAEPKVMRQAVPAGSVYYFTLDGEMPESEKQIIDLFHGQCISDYDQRQGFGLTFVGGVQT